MSSRPLSVPEKVEWILLLLILVKFLVNFLLPSSVYELHRDEYLYYVQGQHLDFGFLENPPLLSLLGYVSYLFGGTVFWIKFWPALFGSLTLWLTWKMAGELGGNKYAKTLAACGILFSAFMRVHYLFQPNFLDIFFWSLSAYFLICFCTRRNEKYLFALSVALALGWWSKNSVLFMLAAIVFSLLITQYRFLFLRPKFWLAALTFLVLVLPNILWQYTHRFPLLHHMNELRQSQLQYLDRAGFLKEQLLFLFPACFVWITGLFWLLTQRRFSVIGFTYLFVIILLLLGSGKGYYALGAYPMLLAAGGVCLEKSTIRKPLLRTVLIGIILVAGLAFVPLLLPMQSPATMAAFNKQVHIDKIGLLKWEDQKNHLLQQDFADMLGWKELAEKSEAFYHKQPDSSQAGMVVYGRSYGIAGALTYYAKDASYKKKIIGDNGSFLLWIPEKIRFKNLLFIGWEMPHADDAVFQHFRKVTVIDSCTNIYSRQYGYKIIYFENASDTAWQLAQKGLAEKKAVFHR